jgi:2-amino-4-hydroxy-6-hydroxymethyldihydropteridine diphosphokinase
MTMQQGYLGLGSNLGKPVQNLLSAFRQIARAPGIRLTACSGLYRSPPWGLTRQPEFVNAVARIDTSLDADVLLERLLSIESALGRQRTGDRWGPRVIDVDLLLLDDLVIDSETLQVPHPRMHLRAFVLLPLLELLPDCNIPGIGRAEQCLQSLTPEEVNGITLIESSGPGLLVNQ